MRPLKPHEQRVMEEFHQLAERLDKLDAFLAAPKPEAVTPIQWTLLKAQQAAMRLYVSILSQRIEDFQTE